MQSSWKMADILNKNTLIITIVIIVVIQIYHYFKNAYKETEFHQALKKAKISKEDLLNFHFLPSEKQIITLTKLNTILNSHSDENQFLINLYKKLLGENWEKTLIKSMDKKFNSDSKKKIRKIRFNDDIEYRN